MASAIFKVDSAGAARAGRKMGRAGRQLRSVIIAEMRGHEDELTDVFREAAPEDTSLLKEELEARLSFGGRVKITVHSPVRDPDSGYAYTGVTRFGHKGRLYPKRGQYLVWKQDGVWRRATSTAGHHPATDWVADAEPAAQAMAEEIAESTGRVVYARLLT